MAVHGERRRIGPVIRTLRRDTDPEIRIPAVYWEQLAFHLRDNAATGATVEFETMPRVRPLAAVPNDPLFVRQWDMTRIGTPAGWDIATGAGVTTCSLDEVCDPTHPDLSCAAPASTSARWRYAPGDPFGPQGWNFAIIDPAIANAVNVIGLVLGAATGENTPLVNCYPARNPLHRHSGRRRLHRGRRPGELRQRCVYPVGGDAAGNYFGRVRRHLIGDAARQHVVNALQDQVIDLLVILNRSVFQLPQQRRLDPQRRTHPLIGQPLRFGVQTGCNLPGHQRGGTMLRGVCPGGAGSGLELARRAHLAESFHHPERLGSPQE